MYELTPEEETWRLLAVCRTIPLNDLDFGVNDRWLTYICKSSCPVISYCARSALVSKERYDEDPTGPNQPIGVWGGELILFHDYETRRLEKNASKWEELEKLAQERPLREAS